MDPMSRCSMILRVTLIALAALTGCTGAIGNVDESTELPDPPPDLRADRPFQCQPDEEEYGEARLWRLGKRQWEVTVERLLGLTDVQSRLPEDPVGDVFRGEEEILRVRDVEAGFLFRDAQRFASSAISEGSVLADYPCLGDADATCIGTFVRSFGRRAFRRPLTTEEHGRYVELFALGERAMGEGPETVLTAMIQSPHLVYIAELGEPSGDGTTPLTSYELASALSYFFTDAPPDETLWESASSGALNADLSAQVARLMATDEWRGKRTRFVEELLHLDALSHVEKSDGAFPEFGELRDSFQSELDYLIDRGFQRGEADLDLLFQTRDAMPEDDALAAFYGSEGEQLPPHRRGLLTRAGFLSVHAGREITSPVTRGHLIRTNILCDAIGSPPPGANTTVPDPEPDQSQRDTIDRATLGGSCAGCHVRMNDVGFAFGAFDPIGQDRDVDDFGVDLDLSGSVNGTEDADGGFVDLNELLARLANSQQVARCMTTQAFRFASGRTPTAQQQCVLESMQIAGGARMNFEDAIRAYFLSPRFLERKVTP